MPSREDFIQALREGLESRSDVETAWIGGSAATGRLDENSDIDLHVIAADAATEDVLSEARSLLEKVSPLEAFWRAPEPAWHGHSQFFAKPLRSPGPFFFIDLVVMKKSSPEKFMERKRHGEPLVLFDKSGLIRDIPDSGGAPAREKKMEARREQIAAFTPFAEVLVRKEILRRNQLEALTFYQRFLFMPLVELLNMKHRPDRYDFGVRYLSKEVPEEVSQALMGLAFVSDLEDLRRKTEEVIVRLREALSR